MVVHHDGGQLDFFLSFNNFKNKPTAQAAGQTLPDETPPVGKIHPFSKIAVTFVPIQRFRCPSRFKISEKDILTYT